MLDWILKSSHGAGVGGGDGEFRAHEPRASSERVRKRGDSVEEPSLMGGAGEELDGGGGGWGDSSTSPSTLLHFGLLVAFLTIWVWFLDDCSGRYLLCLCKSAPRRC